MAKVQPIRPATVALVGGESLMGREIRDILAGHSEITVRLVADEAGEAGRLTEQAGEPAVVGALDEEALQGARAVFLAGSEESSRKALEIDAEGALIDLTCASDEAPDARLRAPVVEPEDYEVEPGFIQVVAHPAAIALALVLKRLHDEFSIARSVVHVFEPASERGAAGIDELQQQTVNLLSFKSLPKAIFDSQLSFNMLARYGEEAPLSLEEIEGRIERHLATLLANSGGAPPPSLRLIQAPVFHGHSFSLWVEFESGASAEEIEQVLSPYPVDVRSGEMEPPNVVGVAGQTGVAVGGIATDRNNANASWIWMASDNLRLAAENAVAAALPLL